MTRIGSGNEQSDDDLSNELHDDAVAGVEEPADDPWAGRHMSVQHFKQLFDYQHLPEGLQHVSAPFKTLAEDLLNLGDGPELSACLRKLLEAKDCAVRQALQDGFGEITRVRSGR